MRQRIIDGILVTKPTKEDIDNLKVGDPAPNSFGKMAEVSRIFARGIDVKGKAYVCYYTRFGETSELSGDLTEDEIVCTVPLTHRFKTTDAVPWQE